MRSSIPTLAPCYCYWPVATLGSVMMTPTSASAQEAQAQAEDIAAKIKAIRFEPLKRIRVP